VVSSRSFFWFPGGTERLSRTKSQIGLGWQARICPRSGGGKPREAHGARGTIWDHKPDGSARGGLVKAAWFKRYRENDLPERFDRIVQRRDTANKVSELSDFSVCTTWGVKDKAASARERAAPISPARPVATGLGSPITVTVQ
jgi:hypothetical protein